MLSFHKQIQYNEQITGLFIDTLQTNPASDKEIHKLLSHCLNAMIVWAARVNAQTPDVEVWQLHAIGDLHTVNRTAHHMWYDILDACNLHGLHTYQNSSGNTFTNSLEEIATHVIIHSAHHRGQIASLWRRQGIQPPSSDFIFWVRQGT
ncbi:MAG: hypothetical protein Kow0075_00980 [Salibacteraceae bacterium]